MILQGKKIILTGAAGGIGQAIAIAAAKAGASLALCERTPALAAQAINAIPKASAHSTHSGDLTDAEAITAMIAAATDALGGLDGVVNNAATLAPDDASAIDTPLQAWQDTLAVNLTGTFLICQQSLPHLVKAKGGSIVNMSSVVAHRGSAIAQIAYTASKGGVESMTREIAMTYARDNIRANCVAAGPVLTTRTAHYFDTEEKWKTRRQHIPSGRLGKPEEIAALVCFLLSDNAAYQTGSTIFADGGISAAYITHDRNGQDTP